jgi:hypothetical protein
MADGGRAEVVDASFLVDRARQCQSAAELACTRTAIGIADAAFEAVRAAYNGYHCCTGRAFSLGENPFWEKALTWLSEGVESTIVDMRPGTPTVEWQRRMDAHVDAIGTRDYV